MKTIQGDTWDVIAWREMGSTRHTEALINANRHLIETQVFDAGVEVTIPTVESALKEVAAPWIAK